MDEDKKRQILRELEGLRRDLRGMRDSHRVDPELEYFMTRLSAALNANASLEHRLLGSSMHLNRAELLAKIDALIKHTDEVRELADHIRGVLLRPPPPEEEK
jgi:hypothetical protein